MSSFDFEDMPWGAPDIQSPGIKDLTLDSVKFGDPPGGPARVGTGFQNLLHIFPILHQLELRSMDHVPPEWIIPSVARS